MYILTTLAGGQQENNTRLIPHEEESDTRFTNIKADGPSSLGMWQSDRLYHIYRTNHASIYVYYTDRLANIL